MSTSVDHNTWYDWYDEFNCPLEPLKPCPCCGGEAWLKDNGYEEPEIDSNGAYVGMDINEPDYIWVECQSCGLTSLGAGTPEEAISKWNQRASNDVKYGVWKIITFHNGCTPDYDCVCSECGASGTPDKNYCPNCGAKMYGEMEATHDKTQL